MHEGKKKMCDVLQKNIIKENSELTMMMMMKVIKFNILNMQCER